MSAPAGKDGDDGGRPAVSQSPGLSVAPVKSPPGSASEVQHSGREHHHHGDGGGGSARHPSPTKKLSARPGSIAASNAKQSYTLASVFMAMSESTLRELAKKGMSEAVAFHRGNTAERVIKSVPYPETAHLDSDMLFDPTTDLPSLNLLRTHFIKEGRLTVDAAKKILTRTAAIFRERPNIQHLNAPVTICGDLHGQFYDLLTVFDLAGALDKTDGTYLFLGDYVDRGSFSTECVLYLCAAVLNYPDRIYLLRGNHESRLMCEYMTFFCEVQHKYDMEIYDEFQALFDTLQLAAVVHGSPNGDCLCVHGGLSPGIATLEDIEAIDRFQEIPKKTPFWDLVWADPLPELEAVDIDAFGGEEQWKMVTFIPNEFRRSSFLFGLNAVQTFLATNHLCCIIRGHQVQLEGYCEHFVRSSRTSTIAPVLTVFSAPNYCDQYGNCAAFIQIHPDRFVVQQFYGVAHPHVLPGFVDGISWSLQLLLEKVVEILQQLVLGMIRDGTAETEEEKIADEALAEKTRSLYQKIDRLRSQQASIRAMQNESYHKNMSLFERILKQDQENEATPQSYASNVSFSSANPAHKRASSFHL